MHKSSERSDNGCVWNEDAPTVVSCAFFRLSEPVVIFNRRLFCVPPYRLDGKDTAMKNNDSKKRKSGFNPNRTCYLTADGKYYCYERWNDDAKCVVTQRLEVGKDLSLELTIMLDESDHNMDLQDRYEGELRDPLFDAKVNSYKADPDNEDAVDPWDTLADKSAARKTLCSPSRSLRIPRWSRRAASLMRNARSRSRIFSSSISARVLRLRRCARPKPCRRESCLPPQR